MEIGRVIDFPRKFSQQAINIRPAGYPKPPRQKTAAVPAVYKYKNGNESHSLHVLQSSATCFVRDGPRTSSNPRARGSHHAPQPPPPVAGKAAGMKC